MGNIITPVLPHDLPENWNDTQYVSPGGTEVGLTEKHGYNYLMKQVNNSQKAINELDAELENIDTALQNKAPIYQSNVSYPADAQVVWKGNVWKNTSGQSVTGVEPGTNYNIWNVGYSNPNLLDNPWFTVNQRGKDNYTGARYSVDRWYLWSGTTLTRNSNGSITISAGDWRNLIQIFELDLFNKLVGKTVTASVLLDDGTVSSRTFVFTDPGNGYNQINLYPNPFSGKVFCLNLYGPSNSNIANRPYFNIYTNVNFTIKAVKLELGSVSTLANDVPPNYQQELAKCQRYFQVIPRFGAIGVNAWGSSVELYYWMPTTMRTIPSATFSSDLSDAIHEMGSRSLTPDSMILDGSSFLSTEKIAIVVRGSNMSTGKVYGNNTIILLTADL